MHRRTRAANDKALDEIEAGSMAAAEAAAAMRRVGGVRAAADAGGVDPAQIYDDYLSLADDLAAAQGRAAGPPGLPGGRPGRAGAGRDDDGHPRRAAHRRCRYGGQPPGAGVHRHATGECAAADAQAATGRRNRLLTVAVGLVLASLAGAVLVGRPVSRARGRLADQAEQISEGRLVDISGRGPP